MNFFLRHRPVTAEAFHDLADRIIRPGQEGRVEDTPLRPIAVGSITVDPVYESIEVAGVAISLSRTEFTLVHTLAQEPGTVVPHHALLEACWPDEAPSLTAVDSMVYRLRRKLSQAPHGKEIVRTVRGRGYVLAPPKELSKREPSMKPQDPSQTTADGRPGAECLTSRRGRAHSCPRLSFHL